MFRKQEPVGCAANKKATFCFVRKLVAHLANKFIT